MRSRPIWLALVIATIVTALLAAPAVAGRPRTPTPPQSTAAGERPLTPDELAASRRRVAEALAYVASQRAAGGHLVSLSCPTPFGTTARHSTSCGSVPQSYLPVTARDQIRNHYCGPAVGQVIANYTWNVAAGSDRYGQTAIAGWMKTDINGSTDAINLEIGLEAATMNAPRRPVGWNWVVTNVRDEDGDGTTADELHAFVVSNVSRSRMPLAIPVKPHDAGSNFNLSSWPKAVTSVGHWIAVYGWYGHWNGTDFSRVYFADSSRDEGGSTGLYWNSTRSLAALVREHTGRLVW